MIDSSPDLINTLLQRGVGRRAGEPNRISGFKRAVETVLIETVLPPGLAQNTPLKQGVNEKGPLRIGRFENGLVTKCSPS